MSPERFVKDVFGPYTRVYGAGDGNRTHVRSLGSFYTAIVRRPPISLAWRLYITKRLVVQSGHFTYFQFKAARHSKVCSVPERPDGTYRPTFLRRRGYPDSLERSSAAARQESPVHDRRISCVVHSRRLLTAAPSAGR